MGNHYKQPNEDTNLIYMDADNSYGGTMRKYVPTGKFQCVPGIYVKVEELGNLMIEI